MCRTEDWEDWEGGCLRGRLGTRARIMRALIVAPW
jgi:hypothetical protein